MPNIVIKVPEGVFDASAKWGANGQILRLPDFAKAAGYKHLQHLVVADPS